MGGSCLGHDVINDLKRHEVVKTRDRTSVPRESPRNFERLRKSRLALRHLLA